MIELISKKDKLNPTNGLYVPAASIIGSGELVGVDDDYFYISNLGDNESFGNLIVPHVQKYSREIYNIRVS